MLENAMKETSRLSQGAVITYSRVAEESGSLRWTAPRPGAIYHCLRIQSDYGFGDFHESHQTRRVSLPGWEQGCWKDSEL